MNVDVAIFKDGSGGLGFIIQDSQGQVLMFACKRIPVLGNPSEGEALALIYSLQIASETSFTELKAESDNPYHICCLQNLSIPNNGLGLLVEDVLHSSNLFTSISFNYYFKEANKPAHHLARLASFFSSDTCIWMEEVPPLLSTWWCPMYWIFLLPLNAMFPFIKRERELLLAEWLDFHLKYKLKLLNHKSTILNLPTWIKLLFKNYKIWIQICKIKERITLFLNNHKNCELNKIIKPLLNHALIKLLIKSYKI